MQMTKMTVICIVVMSVLALGLGVRADFQDGSSQTAHIPVNFPGVKEAADFAVRRYNANISQSHDASLPNLAPLKLVKVISVWYQARAGHMPYHLTLLLSDGHKYEAVVLVPDSPGEHLELGSFAPVGTAEDDKTDSALTSGSSSKADSGGIN